MELRGTVAIVTGGTGGLGGITARRFAEAGADLALVYQRSTDVAEQRAEELRKLGVRVIPIRADVSTVEGAAAMVEQTMAEFGRIDTLVNNAAFNQWIPFSDLDALTDEIWNFILTTNLTGPFRCTKAVAPIMRRQEQGRIINIASVAGLNPGGSSIAYAVSKAGLIHLTRCMAVALAPHVLVNSVSPGLMEGTRMTANLDPAYAQRGRERSLLKRAAHKEDVADQVLAFARTDSTTGQTVVIDSGVVFH